MLGIYFDGLFFNEDKLIDYGFHSVFYHYLKKRFNIIKELSINSFTKEVDEHIEDENYKLSSAISRSILNSAIKEYDENLHQYLLEIALFYERYLSKGNTLEVKTSGSTSEPKVISVKKEYMKNSALKTIKYLNLHEKDSALICMPLDFIAGKMMLLRALIANLEIKAIKPCVNPLLHIHNNILITELIITSLIKENHYIINSDKSLSLEDRERFEKKAIISINDNIYIFEKISSSFLINFIAITTMQAFEICQNPNTKGLLNACDNVLIGGGSISSSLHDILESFTTNVYQSYGMTETLSHIALKNISKKDKYYHVLDNVEISLSDKDTLVIKAFDICDDVLITNDIANIIDNNTFDIVGRIDNVINTGGLKVVADDLENQIKKNINFDNLYISYVDDDKLQQKIVLVLNMDLKDFYERFLEEKNLISLDNLLDKVLEKYQYKECDALGLDNCCSYINDNKSLHNIYINLNNDESRFCTDFLFDGIEKNKRPKVIFFLDSVPLSDTYKIRRKELYNLVNTMYKK